MSGRSTVQSIPFGVSAVSCDDTVSLDSTDSDELATSSATSAGDSLLEGASAGWAAAPPSVFPDEQPTRKAAARAVIAVTQGDFRTNAHLAFPLHRLQQRVRAISQAIRLPACACSANWWRCRESNPGPCRILPFFYVRSRAVAVSAPALCTALRGGGPVTVWFSARSRDRSDW